MTKSGRDVTREFMAGAKKFFEFARKNGICISDGPFELIKVRVPGGTAFKRINIPKILHRAKLINIPKLKTHVCAMMTCAIKNLMGLGHDRFVPESHYSGTVDHPTDGEYQ